LEILAEAEQTFEKAKDGLDKAQAILIIACASARIAEANRLLAHAPLSLPFLGIWLTVTRHSDGTIAQCQQMILRSELSPYSPLPRLVDGQKNEYEKAIAELTRSVTFIQRQSGTDRGRSAGSQA